MIYLTKISHSKKGKHNAISFITYIQMCIQRDELNKMNRVTIGAIICDIWDIIKNRLFML